MRRRRRHLVRELAELLYVHELTEISAVDRGGVRFTLRRDELAASHAPAKAATQETTKTVTAPIAGVFYSSMPGTDAPFVRVGDVLTPGRCVGIIVDGDLAHEIVANNVAGRAARILPADGDHVDAGQALLELEPA